MDSLMPSEGTVGAPTCYLTIECNCSVSNVPPDAKLQKKTNLSTLILGLAGTGDRNRATCVAGSCTNRSAIHYDLGDQLRLTGFYSNRKKLVFGLTVMDCND
jgi:hypothetical protein